MPNPTPPDVDLDLITEMVLRRAFGIVADGPNAIRRTLAKNQTASVEQLARFAGKVETLET